MSSKSQKRQRPFIFVNTIQYQRTLKNNIYYSNKREPPPILGHVLVHSVGKTHILVVTVELMLVLNIFSFNFVPTPSKSPTFTRFRRSYVNHPAVVLTNHCQSYTVFLIYVRCLSCHVPIFCSCLSQMIVHQRNLFLLRTRVARMLLTPRRVSKRKDVKQLSMNISKQTVGVKHSISRKTTFSPNFYLVEKEILECFPILQH